MSGETLEDIEAAGKALAEKRNVDSGMFNAEEAISDAQLENKVETAVELETLKHEETNSREQGGEKTIIVDNDGENTTISVRNDDYVMHLYQNTSDCDEDDDLWEYDDDDDSDSEEDDDETAIDEDEVSDEEGTVGEDDVYHSEGDDEETDIDKDKVSEKEAIDKEDVEEENAEKQIAKGDERETEELNVEKVEVNRKVNKSKGRREVNNMKEDSSKKLASGNTPKSSSKRKGKKRVESMGMIFMCSSKTKNDCFRYRVLGLPESKKDIVEKIYPGMRLFLYDVDLKLMYGIYKARGSGGYNIEPKAFKSKFPSQVRFTILADCLPLAEKKFKKVIKENYFTKNKFDCKLKSEQVKNLCMLFESTSKGKQPKQLPRSQKTEKQPIPIPRETTRKRRVDDKRRVPALREKVRYIEHPRKRPRNHQPPPAPLTSSVPLISSDRTLDVDPYRRDPYLERRDPYLERRDPYRDKQGPYLDRRDPYRDIREPYLYRHIPYTDARDLYPDRRDRYRDSDPYQDSRVPYTQHRVYKDVPQTEAYGPYRRDLVSERRDLYREDRGVMYRDASRLDGALDRPLSLERGRRYDDVSQDPYLSSSYRGIPSNAQPLYYAEYPSRTGSVRQYGL